MTHNRESFIIFSIMKSMTGFGRGAVVESDFAVTVELKTVNNRFLDVALRLSSELSPLESTIKRLIAKSSFTRTG